MRNCFDGYLTDRCKACVFWGDGVHTKDLGCCAPFPIMKCPEFAKVYKEEQREERK